VTRVLAHYDRWAPIIDVNRDWPYRRARQAAIDELQLSAGDTAIDLFCGTGVNFEPLLRGVGPQGQVIGVDGSGAMLRRAEQRIRRQGLDGSRIELHRVDITRDQVRLGEILRGPDRPPKLLISLALSCFADYDRVFGDVYDRMPGGSRVAILEGPYFERRSLACRFVDWIGAADCTRRTWEPLERRLAGYRRIDFPLHFSTLIVASGTKA